MQTKRHIGRFPVMDKLKFVFQLFGIWPIDTVSKYKSMLNKVYSLVIFVLFFLCYDLSLSIYLFYVEDVQDATDNLTINLTLIVVLGKMLNFKIYFRRIIALLRMSEEFTLESDQEIVFAAEQMSPFSKVTTLNRFVVNACCVFAYAKVFYTDERELPFPGWFPFDWKRNTTAYVLLYIYQIIGMIIQSNLSPVLDMLPAYLMSKGI